MPQTKPRKLLFMQHVMVWVRPAPKTKNRLLSYILDCYDELREILTPLKANKLLIVADSCSSGGFAGDDQGILGDNVLYPGVTGTNRIVCAASLSATDAYGAYFDGNEHWVIFGYWFWKMGLGENKGDAGPMGNKDGKTSVEEAWQYAKHAIIDHVGQSTVVNEASQPCMNDQYNGECFIERR